MKQSNSESVIPSRQFWESALEKMHQNDDDRLIFPDVFEEDILED